MNKLKRTMLAGIASSLLLAAGSAQSQDVTEKETNDPVSFAQKLEVSGSGNAVVSGVLGVITGNAVNDTDYYYFSGKEGDVVTIDIDGAFGGQRSFDSIVAVFQSVPGFPKLRESDDADDVDEGSTSTMDSRIDNFRLPATGNYVIGVSNYPRFFENGGGVTNGSYITNGDYTLRITGVSPDLQQINIDIKPGSTGLTPINPQSKGKIPVAVLSSRNFNALTTDPASLTFGATGSEASLSHCGKSGEDVNGDGLPDLVCHFQNQLAGFQKGDLEAILRGRTKTGTAFEGRGLLKVVPAKRGS